MISDSSVSSQIYSDLRKSKIQDWISTCTSLNHKIYSLFTNKDKLLQQYKTTIEQMRGDSKNIGQKSLFGYCSETIIYFELVNEWQYWYPWANDVIKLLESKQRYQLYFGFGRFFEETDQFNKAEEFHKQAIDFFSKKENNNALSLALNYLGLGIVYSRLSNAKANYYLSESKKLLFRLREYYYWACAVADIGGNQYREEKLFNAIISYIQAIFIFYLFRFHEDLQRTLYSLSIALIKTRYFKLLAFPILLLAKKYTNKSRISRYPILLLYSMGRLLSELKRYKEADSFLDSALQNYKIYYDQFRIYPENMFNILYHITLVNIKSKNWDNGYKYCQYLETFTLDNIINAPGPELNPETIRYYDSLVTKILNKFNDEKLLNDWQQKVDSLYKKHEISKNNFLK